MGPSLRVFVGFLLTICVSACVGSTKLDREPIATEQSVIDLLNKGILRLNLNIDALSKHIYEVQHASPGTDPVLRELQALDLSGWQLHRQQWVLQRDHLVLARDSLQQAYTNQGEKQRLLDRWRQHWQEYVKAVEELRHQRHDLENKQLEVEARLIERGLQ